MRSMSKEGPAGTVSDLAAVGAQGDDGGVEQNRRRDGLDEDVFKAAFLGLLQHLLAAIGGHHHEMGRGVEVGQSENALAGFDAVHARHLPIDEGDLVAFAGLGGLTDHPDRLFARRRLVGNEGHVGQHVRQYGAGMRDCRR